MRGGYGLYFNTNSYQNLIVTVTNPPATPRFIVANPKPCAYVAYGNVSATSSGTGVPPTVSAMYCFPSSM